MEPMVDRKLLNLLGMKILVSLTAVLAISAGVSSCSKVDIHNPPVVQARDPAPADSTLHDRATPGIAITAAVPTTPAVQQAPRIQSPHGRVVEIDRLLSLPLTGTQADADQRITLRAERDALTGGMHRTVVAQQTAPQRHEPVRNPQQIVVAGDSRQHDLPRLEQMTPGERKRYLEAVRAHNTQTVIVDRRY